MRRRGEAEDTGAAVAEVTWAVSAELTSELTWVASEELAWKELAKAALAVSAELALEVLAEVTWRAFTEVTLAMERAFAEVALQFQQRLRLGNTQRLQRCLCIRARTWRSPKSAGSRLPAGSGYGSRSKHSWSRWRLYKNSKSRSLQHGCPGD